MTDRPDPSPQSTTRRRTVLAAVTALVGSVAGCANYVTNSPETDAPESPESGPVPATVTETERQPDTPTPALNQTSFPVVRQGAPDASLPDTPLLGDDRALGLLTSPDWRESVNEAVLIDASRSFLSATDFDTETVVAFEMNLSDIGNLLALLSVDGVGTSSLDLSIRQLKVGSLNAEEYQLLLVRVPNRGTEPTRATATVTASDDTEPITVSTDG